MDPISTMSLVCGIIQIVDFSTKVVKKCRELYKNGALSENEDIEQMARYLANLHDHLNVPSQQDSRELLELGRKCSNTAVDLVKEMQKLKIHGSSTKLEIVGKTWKTIRKKRAIEAISKRLDGHRNVLDTHVLVNLRNRVDLLSLQQHRDFGTLDKRLQRMITSLAAGSVRLDELAVAIFSESASIKDHVSREFQQHSRGLADKDQARRFRESLWFPEIHRRKETIKEAHAKTFQWIFETGVTRMESPKWDDFVQWLKRGQDTYWIHGKAGSGKSTLMSFIHEDARTRDALKLWSGTKKVFTPSFFFWKAGSKMEKSSEGLLRSLLHQTLELFPLKTPTTIRYLEEIDFVERPDYEFIPAWTERRLWDTLHNVMLQIQDAYRICIIIDGLDECDGDQMNLISTVRQLQCPDIKICLSSRPDQSFSDAFSFGAKLRLQDLTEADIDAFVTKRLQDAIPAISAQDVTEFLKTITYKAEGVFLWVDIVVSDLLRGLRNNDSISHLRSRLEHMPSDVEELYAHMLTNIEEVYREDAIMLFQLTLVGLTGSLLNVSLALYNAFNQRREVTIQEAIEYCELTKKRLPTMCAGLLEVRIGDRKPHLDNLCWGNASHVSVPDDHHTSSDLAKVFSYEMEYHVDFFHRTTVDFFRECQEGKRFMEIHTPSTCNPYGSYVQALLAKVRLLGLPTISTNMSFGTIVDQYFRGDIRDVSEEEIHRAIVNEVMDKLVLAELRRGTAQVFLCEAVDSTLGVVHQRQTCHCDNLHWCSLWGFQEIRAKYSFVYKVLSMQAYCSQSSSTMSFHTALGDQKDDDLGVISTEPVDFLGLACSWGLAHYVQKALDSMIRVNDREKATNLLCCCMRAFRPHPSYFTLEVRDTAHPRWLGPLHLVGELLKHGADPNCYVKDFATTIWGEFLERLEGLLCVDPLWCGKLVHLFVENGADLHQAVYITKSHSLPGISLRERAYDGGACPEFCTRHKVTTLYRFQECLLGTSDFETLEKNCISLNVRSSSWCTHVRLNGRDQGLLVERGPYRMSKVQSNKFEAAITGYSEAFHLGNRMRRLECGLQAINVWKEIENNAKEADVWNLSDEDVISDDTDEFHSTSSKVSLSS